ncbi:MAG: DNA repair ATPase [Saprospiraceae bacterium]|nr:DNA repair ATPase [Saprospiraceae bacterium]
MANTPNKEGNIAEQQDVQLESGTYEIIRSRLLKQTGELKNRLDQLNSGRKEVFGAIETQLIANDRINTSNNCVARDIIALGNHCIFGYNVHIGLRSGIQLKDVFSIYDFQDNVFQETDLSLIQNEKFAVDFQNLYRYYKDAFFARFVQQGTYLYMVFQISSNVNDFKAFKWLIVEDRLEYIDARSDHEVKAPEQYEFKWVRAHRDMQRLGEHPHISIMDRVFVETVGGDLTIKVEDNTDDGLGIYREEVDMKDQTLDDAEYFYADLGNLIALRIRPYQEDFRYFVYNEKIQQVQRIDALKDSGVLLPDGHGLIFANGYYLQTGDFKIFDPELKQKQFKKRIVSPNGEDYLYVFYNHHKGTYVLLHYNLIEQTVQTPIICHGYSIFPNGELAYFRAEEEPTKHHVVQIWQTPFVSGDEVPSEHTDTFLYKIGNKDIVKAMSECYEILTLANKDDSYAGLYADLAKKATDVIDSYYWISNAETFQLSEPLSQIRETANAAIEEYEKKVSIQRNTEETIEKVRSQALDLFQQVKRQSFDSIDLFVAKLAELRTIRGEIIGLKDLRYTKPQLIEQLEEEAAKMAERLSEECVGFLLQDDALQPYEEKIESCRSGLEEVHSAKAGKELEEAIDQIGEELQLMIDIVSNLKIDDATQTTRILDNISAMYAQLNQVKAAVRRRQKELMGKEAVAEFNAQFKLLDQAIINYLDVANTPQKCDDFLTKLMIQLEELESKFAEFDEFIDQVAEKREEIYAAFENRKKQLLEALNNRTAALQRAGERILNGIQNRSKTFKEVNEINAFFASDLMVDKVRDLIDQLKELDDSNKANGLQTRLKTLKEEAIRQLRDKQDLFVEGENVLKLGQHHFSVNVQALDLTIVEREGKLYFHLTGTDFYEEITDPALNEHRKVWNQALVSENEDVYRSEYLAYQIFKTKQLKPEASLEDIMEVVRQEAGKRYQEGYTKGIHDVDAAHILQALMQLSKGIDLLYFSADVRALAQFIWSYCLPKGEKESLQKQLDSAGILLSVFPETHEYDYLIEEIRKAMQKSLAEES